MDKYEYKLRSEEIRELIAQREYVKAAQIADTIDWRRVKSVMMLCTISDLYKINRRFEDSRNLLLLAYDRHPGGRTIVYSLCELSIKMGDVVEAIEYYKEFVQVAPKDTGRYILQYKLYEAQDVSLEERIAVLEELKKRDYREKWAYELAYLYHRIGLATRCVEECDELILWFGDGKYVIKAMELKMLHCDLAPLQQEKYDGRFQGTKEREESIPDENNQEESVEENSDIPEATKRIPSKEIDIQVKTLDVNNKFNTINLQKELAESMKEFICEPQSTQSSGQSDLSEELESAANNFSQKLESEENSLPEEQESVEDILPEETEAKEEALPEEVRVKEEVFFGESSEIDETASIVMEQIKQESMNSENLEGNHAVSEQKQPGFEKMLGMEYDGQLSLVVPESDKVEKQITGQICFEDVLLEWEKLKKENEQKRMEAVRQRVLEHTGNLFTEFEASVRDSLLEQLEGKGTNSSAEIVENEIPEDEIVENEIPEDEIVEDKIPEDEIVEDEIPEDEIPEDEISEDEIVEDEIVEDEIPEDEIPEDEIPEDEIPEDEIVENDEVEELEEIHNEDEILEDTNFEEELAEDIAANCEKAVEEQEQESIRELTEEEQELFSSFIQNKNLTKRLIQAIDTISLASYTGNMIVTGEEGAGTLTFAKNLLKNVQITDSNFSGKLAKITGSTLNFKDVAATLEKISNGALIITKASQMTTTTVEKLKKSLDQENQGMIVILEDTFKNMNRFLDDNKVLKDCFNARFDIEALDNKSLAAFGRNYAKEQEYAIDELGMLALHTRIADMQTSEHAVTITDVKEIVDEAIEHADRKSFGHFMDILLAKRYDEEDMIILREKDFI